MFDCLFGYDAMAPSGAGHGLRNYASDQVTAGTHATIQFESAVYHRKNMG